MRHGDVNPYGVAVAPVTTGRLVAGNVQCRDSAPDPARYPVDLG